MNPAMCRILNIDIMYKGIITLLVLTSCGFGQAIEKAKLVDKLMDVYDIRENFKGFIYSNDFTEGVVLNIQSFPGEFNEKQFSGIWVKVDKTGSISKIGPLYNEALGGNGIKLWAYDQFKASKLSLDAVWQIDRASSPAAESDKKIISSMLLSLMHGDGNEKLRESEIRRGDRIWSSLEAIAKSENDNRFSDKEIISITIKDVIKFLRIE
jgi:hypothetical protein